MKRTTTLPDSESPQPLSIKIPSHQVHPSRAELVAMGKALRDRCPRESHAEWNPPHQRLSPVRLLKQGDRGRIPHLVPIRHGRMLESPFTFYRGAALNMAADLASTPVTGFYVQACGDAHLVNFRGFATAERRLIFDIHDLDETLSAPWEWDLKRLAASFVIACRDNGLGNATGAEAARVCAQSYREHIIEYGKMRVLDVWYSSIGVEELLPTIRDEKFRDRLLKRIDKEQKRSALEYDFPKLAHTVQGSSMIRDNPPTIFHYHGKYGSDEFESIIQKSFEGYRNSLPPTRHVLLDHYDLKDVAIKVVGVGSVGTFCAVALLMASPNDPLFLQIKEARASVLEPYAGKSVFANHGQRVVNGHHMMQSASDIFLGWSKGTTVKNFYVRQLRDMKIKPNVENLSSTEMILFAEWCGWTLARAHSRDGEPAVIGGYLGKSEVFDKAIAAFAIAYANQNELDYELVKKAASKGKLEVAMER